MNKLNDSQCNNPVSQERFVRIYSYKLSYQHMNMKGQLSYLDQLLFEL